MPRLRIYGNQALLEEVNRVVAAGAGLPPRKLQKVSTNTGTVCSLYYTGEVFEAWWTGSMPRCCFPTQRRGEDLGSFCMKRASRAERSGVGKPGEKFFKRPGSLPGLFASGKSKKAQLTALDSG
ncbi:MAG: hypothetical protein HPY58_01595 [Firmicutes bacterium]|nr:hypothetical protein [Bacillota bacterium]